MDQHEDRKLSAILKTQAEHHAAPAALRARIVSAIRQAEAAAPPQAKAQGWRQWLPMGAAFALGVVASFTAAFYFMAVSAQERLAQEVVASHVRSLMVAHLADIASTDRHTVKPWFNGKLVFSPPVHDLAEQAFPLVGGRLDYLGGQPAAALVYRRHLHTINVFVRPRDARAPAPPTAFAAQGYHVTGWQGAAMQFWIVSDLNADELRQFAQHLRQATEAGS